METAATRTAPRAARLRRDHAVAEYDRRGYMILPGLLDPALVAAARAESVIICRGDRGKIDGLIPAGKDEDDDVVLRRYLCIHFPHKVSSLARDLARLPAAVQPLTEIIGPNVKMMQSMLFIKSRGQAGPGLAPGRDPHPNARPIADRGLDRARRRHDREWLPVGDPGFTPSRRAVPGPGSGRPALRLYPGGLRISLP